MSRKRDGLYRRGNIFAFRYKDADGVWREKQTGKRDRPEAKDFRADFLNDLKTGTLPTRMSEWTLQETRSWWLEFRKPRIAAGTLTAEGYRLKPMIAILGNLRLRQITSVELDNYVTQRLADQIAPWSINKEVLTWSMILKKAKLWRRLADDYKPLKTKASDIGRALSREELRQLASVATRDEDWEAAFYGSVLAANTGLRGGEIKKLRIGSIDLEKRQLRVRRADTKSDAGSRTIELNRDAREAAARLLLRASLLKPPAIDPSHYLMPKHLSRIAYGQHKGDRGYDPTQHQQYWDTAWHSLTREAGFKGLRFHDLRHTFISHMVELGVPLGVIQTFVGHMSARMVRHYTHISSGAARKAVELLDSDPILAPVEAGDGKVYRV
ncbi:MAG TPA: site-specific integrase [Terriglobales bacterium]|jgi:integrase